MFDGHNRRRYRSLSIGMAQPGSLVYALQLNAINCYLQCQKSQLFFFLIYKGLLETSEVVKLRDVIFTAGNSLFRVCILCSGNGHEGKGTGFCDCFSSSEPGYCCNIELLYFGRDNVFGNVCFNLFERFELIVYNSKNNLTWASSLGMKGGVWVGSPMFEI